jgi:hypothetical protein
MNIPLKINLLAMRKNEKSIKPVLLTNNITEKRFILSPFFTTFATYASTTE